MGKNFYDKVTGKTGIAISLCAVMLTLAVFSTPAFGRQMPEERRRQEQETVQRRFEWWPTDAQPGPVKDEVKGGYWWWPTTPGEARPWGNRGYIYVNKIIFDYKAEELPPPKPKELRPSLLIKKIIRNVKIYYDYNKADIRSDAVPILEDAVRALQRNPQADILITGNCDVRGSEAYNERLGRQRGEAVKEFMLAKGIEAGRIRIISRGKLDAVAPVTDLVGMQKDRNAHFMVAEVEEVMIPAPDMLEEDVKKIEEGKYMMISQEEVTSDIRVQTKEYVVQKGDSLWSIAKQHLGSGHRWKYLYEMNKDRIRNPNSLRVGTRLIIPIE